MKTTRGLSRRDFDKRFGENGQCIEFLAAQNGVMVLFAEIVSTPHVVKVKRDLLKDV